MDQLRAYRILGILPGSSREEIRDAYRKKAVLLHPETHPAEFAELQEAWLLLKKETGKKEKTSSGFPGILTTENKKDVPGQEQELHGSEDTCLFGFPAEAGGSMETLFAGVDQAQEQEDQEEERLLLEMERAYGVKERQFYQKLRTVMTKAEAVNAVKNLEFIIGELKCGRMPDNMFSKHYPDVWYQQLRYKTDCGKIPKTLYKRMLRQYRDFLKQEGTLQKYSWRIKRKKEDQEEEIMLKYLEGKSRQPIPVWAGILMASGWLALHPLLSLAVPERKAPVWEILFFLASVWRVIWPVWLYRRMCFNSRRITARVRIGALMMLYSYPVLAADNIRAFYYWYEILAALYIMVGYTVFLISAAQLSDHRKPKKRKPGPNP